jgi:hypothetical protein
LADADELLRDAEDDLRADGDLGAYQTKVKEAATLIEQALSALQPSTTAPAGEPADEGAPSTPPSSEPTTGS